MRKKQLLAMKEMVPTAEMIQVAQNDKRECQNRYSYNPPVYHYGKMLMAYEAFGILKVSIFSVEHIKFGGFRPIYNIFLDKERKQYIGYDFLRNRWTHAKLDNLDWPEYTGGIKVYTEKESHQCILRYLQKDENENYDPFEEILSYQEALHEERLLERDSKEMGLWEQKMSKIPGVPRDWENWVNKVAITHNFIFYDYKRGGSEQGYCTWCEKTVPISRAKHNAKGRCKCCGRKIQYKSVGRMSNYIVTEDTAYLIQRVSEDEFVVREYYIQKYIKNKDYKKPLIECKERRRLIYDKKMDATEYYYGIYKKRLEGWIEGALKVSSCIGYTEYLSYYRGKVYGRTIPALSKSILQRTGFAEMRRSLKYICPVEYFVRYVEIPFIEQLAKAGLFHIVKELLDGKNLQIEQAGNLGKCLGIDRFRIGRLRKNNGGTIYLKWLQYEKAMNKVIPDSVIKWFEKQHIPPETVKFILDRMSALQIKNYLVRQNRESKENVKDLIITWRDYLNMAKRLQMNISDSIVYKVRSLVKRHDELVRLNDKELLLMAGEIAEKYPNVDQICSSITEKYQFQEDSEYQIIAPTIEMILQDAKGLHHCVKRNYILNGLMQEKRIFCF